MSDLESAHTVSEEKSQHLQHEHDHLVKEADALKREVEDADAQCKAASQTLKQMDEEGFETISRLHPKMPQLLHLIQSNKRSFLHPPVGPLGSFVTVTPGNEQYAKAAEVSRCTLEILLYYPLECTPCSLRALFTP